LQGGYEKYSPVLEIGSDEHIRRTVEGMAEAASKQSEELMKIRTENEDLKSRLSRIEDQKKEQEILFSQFKKFLESQKKKG